VIIIVIIAIVSSTMGYIDFNSPHFGSLSVSGTDSWAENIFVILVGIAFVIIALTGLVYAINAIKKRTTKKNSLKKPNTKS
jgi:tellurite resistance protein TehA-like permease